MQIEEAIELMSKSYLYRILDSFLKDALKPESVEDAKNKILKNKKILTNPEHIHSRVNLASMDFADKSLLALVVDKLLCADEYQMSETQIVNAITIQVKDIIGESQKTDVWKFKSKEAIDTYKVVLEAALHNSQITEDEKRLLARLRNHLGLTLKDHYLLQAQLNQFPKVGNELYTPKEISQQLIELQKRGIIFYCNEVKTFVVPEEIVDGLKAVFDIELVDAKYQLLLDKLTQQQLKVILAYGSLPVSGKKNDQISLIIDAEISPSIALDLLGSEDLRDICKSLEGVNVSGAKADRITRIIDYFDKLKTVISTETEDTRARSYDYFEELAKRDRGNLRANNIIQKDIDIERAFERATDYLFEQKCNLSLIDMPGTEHADGALALGKDIILWDNKSQENSYTFPNSHLNQFKRYIHASENRVTCFLIITQDIDECCFANAIRLKSESKNDTDIALISASNLRWAAENWPKFAIKSKQFNLEILNHTGILDRQMIEQRMKTLQK